MEGVVEVEVVVEVAVGVLQLQLIRRLPKKMMPNQLKVSIRAPGARMEGAEVGEAEAQDHLVAILTIVLVAMAISTLRAVAETGA
jgi:hypothetical protein